MLVADYYQFRYIRISYYLRENENKEAIRSKFVCLYKYNKITQNVVVILVYYYFFVFCVKYAYYEIKR